MVDHRLKSNHLLYPFDAPENVTFKNVSCILATGI
jgi:hypothetical protein